jgi:hypothetical protein
VETHPESPLVWAYRTFYNSDHTVDTHSEVSTMRAVEIVRVGFGEREG